MNRNLAPFVDQKGDGIYDPTEGDYPDIEGDQAIWWVMNDVGGDKRLDGKVKDAHDLINRLVKSKRVRQSIIRHAFRYFMGRNEMLSDSKTLIDADQAYVKSGGSFDAVIVSLLTSDSFIYRKSLKE